MANLDDRSKQDFLIYANSVIKSRAIPSVEDNLKPIHRKILWTLFEDKIYADKPTKKCATEVGRALAYSPHGDASVYGALVRLSQWWKLRYPLVEMQGNCGNILGDGPAASRYTECRLSPIGMLMLEDINRDCVDFKPNYDNSTKEPSILPSKFPYLLCGNNSGIAVGMGSDLVSHNFTEVKDAIKYYIEHKDCSISDLMQYIKGPDFPTGGKIINGEDLINIYTTGMGSVKIQAHYDITKKGSKTLITFHDLPYGVEIDDGIKKPLKKLVLEDGYDVFEDVNVAKAGPHNFDITITLGKDADVAKCLEILFNKTKLQSTIKINQNLIVKGEPRTCNLKQLIQYWVDHRSKCIERIAWNEYGKTNHKLTITIGLIKCMSNIDRVIEIVRFENMPKTILMKEFELNDEQATAVLELKLARLSKLEVEKLNSDKKDLDETLAKLKDIAENEATRYSIILKDLEDCKKIVGEDKRLTEIHYNHQVVLDSKKPLVKEEYKIYEDGVHNYVDGTNPCDGGLIDIVFAVSQEDIIGYTASGEVSPISMKLGPYKGACGRNPTKNKFVCVTANGNVKVSLASDYSFKRAEKAIKLKEDDKLIYADFCADGDFLMLFDGVNVLKLPITDLTVASKLTVGVKSGFAHCNAAAVVSDSDNLLFVTKDNKGKLTAVKDFSIDSRGNKGQAIAENTIVMRRFDKERENIYIIPKVGKPTTVSRDKVSIKGRTAIGASLTSKIVLTII